MKPDKPFALTAGELRQSAWTNLKKHLSARLASLRAQNDNDLDEAKTAKLRGRIAEILNLLALDASPDPEERVADEEPGE